MLDALTDPAHGVIASLDEVKAVGHRVAHGGEFFPESCIVTEDVEGEDPLAVRDRPAAQPRQSRRRAFDRKVLPGVPQVTVFDTSFHQSIPAVNYMYALPHAYYEKYRVRKYGFHGTSHKYVAKVGAELAGLDFHNSRIITCHIGNGGSVTADSQRQVLRHLDGLLAARRPGDGHALRRRWTPAPSRSSAKRRA